MEEEVEEADMMDQLMEGERSLEVFKECEEVGTEEDQTDLRQGRGGQLQNGNVHSGFGHAYVQSQAKKCRSGKARSFRRSAPMHSWMRCVMNMFLWTRKRCKVGGTFARTEGTHPECPGDRWVTVNRGPEQMRQERAKRSDELVQVFANLEDGKTVALDTIVSDKVSDTKRRIRNRRSCVDDMYGSFEGKVLKGSDEMRSCGIDDVFAVPMSQRVRGGGMHRNKKDQRTDQAKKRPTNIQASERDPARATAREPNPKAVGRRRGRRARGRMQLQGERDAHLHLDPQAEIARSESEHVLLASGARLREPR